jgi:hypothetical protein
MLPSALAADVVLRIRPEAYAAPFEALAVDIARAMEQLMRYAPVNERTSATPRLPTTGPTGAE